ncbi:uncharacterized protein CLUP02_10057 [Colletotrichum lupini]|uniref:Uncharacterized protein n=1 Tax=Colletotrichum lupini TaxID=145971 RepID=A0A9Q8WJ69_9PEZI|nr:uncharacterized protein CLUP02_10057 [Colletotrichum lupini]UQC84560.1 hypothetical protein CLUP02_10057 [Colletotrichum lupini]
MEQDCEIVTRVFPAVHRCLTQFTTQEKSGDRKAHIPPLLHALPEKASPTAPHTLHLDRPPSQYHTTLRQRTVVIQASQVTMHAYALPAQSSENQGKVVSPLALHTPLPGAASTQLQPRSKPSAECPQFPAKRALAIAKSRPSSFIPQYLEYEIMGMHSLTKTSNGYLTILCPDRQGKQKDDGVSLKTITRYLRLAPPSGLTRCEKACNWDTFGQNVHARKHPSQIHPNMMNGESITIPQRELHSVVRCSSFGPLSRRASSIR